VFRDPNDNDRVWVLFDLEVREDPDRAQGGGEELARGRPTCESPRCAASSNYEGGAAADPGSIPGASTRSLGSAE